MSGDRTTRVELHVGPENTGFLTAAILSCNRMECYTEFVAYHEEMRINEAHKI